MDAESNDAALNKLWKRIMNEFFQNMVSKEWNMRKWIALFGILLCNGFLFAETMTFNSCACHSGFSFSGFSSGGGEIWLQNLASPATITKSSGTWNLQSFYTAAFNGGGNSMKVTSNLGHVHTYNDNYTGWHTLNWNGITWIRFERTSGGGSAGGIDNVTFTIPAANSAPTSSNGSVLTGVNGTYPFSTSDFGYSDTDGDPMDHVQIVSAPSEGTLFVDANSNNIVDGGEALGGSSTVSKANLDAGKLKYLPALDDEGSPAASFTFKVNDGTDYSAASYTCSINIAYIVSVATGSWASSGTWNVSAVPAVYQDALVGSSHTVSVSSNTTVNNCSHLGTISVSGNSILTIEGELKDDFGVLDVSPGSSVVVKGSLADWMSEKVIVAATSGLKIEGDVKIGIDVP